MKLPTMSRKDSYIYNTKRDMLVSYTTNFCIENIFQNLYSSPNLWLFCSDFVNKSCFIVKAVSRICPLDLMMKYVQFQVKKRLSHEVPKVTVELSSSVG